MKKNTRLLAVLLALTILALSLTACASSGKYVAETTTATVSNSAAYDSAPMEEPASTTQETAEFEEMKSEDGALSMTTEVTQDDAPEAASTDVASRSSTRQTSPPRRPTLTRPSQSSMRRSQLSAASSSARTSTATHATMTTAQRASSTAGRITPSASPPPGSRSFSIRPRGIGNVTSISRYAENVTSQYTDYEARLSSLRTQEERLLSMLEKSEDVESLIALEQRLADVRYELESIERNLKNLDLPISYSTITLNLQEVEIYTPTVPVQKKLRRKSSRARSPTAGGASSAAFSTSALTWPRCCRGLVLFVLIVFALFLLVRKIVRKTKARRDAKKLPAPQTPTDSESKPE